jgi:hypothetical protein
MLSLFLLPITSIDVSSTPGTNAADAALFSYMVTPMVLCVIRGNLLHEKILRKNCEYCM